MPPQLVIYITSFSGKRFSGKTTAFSMMKSHLDNVTESAFAYWVKVAAAEKMCDGQVVDLPKEVILDKLLNDGKFKDLHRPLLISIGNGERAKNPQTWVSQTCDEIQTKINEFQLTHTTGVFHFCITDMRFKNEYNYVLRFFSNLSEICKTSPISNTKIITNFFRISSDDLIRATRGWKYDPKVDEDVSECDMDDFSTYCPLMKEIQNNESPIKFYETLYQFLFN